MTNKTQKQAITEECQCQCHHPINPLHTPEDCVLHCLVHSCSHCHPKQKADASEGWEEVFESNYMYLREHPERFNSRELDHIKAFIRSLLKAQEQRVRATVAREIFNELHNHIWAKSNNPGLGFIGTKTLGDIRQKYLSDQPEKEGE